MTLPRTATRMASATNRALASSRALDVLDVVDDAGHSWGTVELIRAGRAFGWRRVCTKDRLTDLLDAVAAVRIKVMLDEAEVERIHARERWN